MKGKACQWSGVPDDHRINVFSIHDPAEVFHSHRLPPVFLVHRVGSPVQATLMDIAHGRHLDFSVLHEVVHISSTHPPDADHADRYLLACRDLGFLGIGRSCKGVGDRHAEPDSQRRLPTGFQELPSADAVCHKLLLLQVYMLTPIS